MLNNVIVSMGQPVTINNKARNFTGRTKVRYERQCY